MRMTYRPHLEALETRTLLSAAILVNVTADGVAGSLREAIAEANTRTDPTTIVLRGALFTLNEDGAALDQDGTADLDITGSIRIVGTGAGGSTIDADGLDRVFQIHPGGALELQNVTVTGGQANSGGGILVTQGSLLVSNSRVVGNSATTWGGGISADSALVNIVDSRVSDNSISSSASAFGGGVSAIGGNLDVSGSTFTDNTATAGALAHGQARGGAIYSEANGLTVSDSLFQRNSVAAEVSDGHGGAINIVLGSGSISGSVFAHNLAASDSGAGGGALAVDRGVQVIVGTSRFESNVVKSDTAFGGAIASFFSGSIYVQESELEDNSALSAGLIAEGGAIYLAGTSAVVEDTIITGNVAMAGSTARGGGIAFFGLFFDTLSIRNSVITGNCAHATANPSNGVGGGVSILFGAATADEDTIISDNFASGSAQDVFGSLTIVPS